MPPGRACKSEQGPEVWPFRSRTSCSGADYLGSRGYGFEEIRASPTISWLMRVPWLIRCEHESSSYSCTWSYTIYNEYSRTPFPICIITMLLLVRIVYHTVAVMKQSCHGGRRVISLQYSMLYPHRAQLRFSSSTVNVTTTVSII